MEQKSKVIEKFLTIVTGISKQEAERLKVCRLCKEPLTSFRDKVSQIEYVISGMCQACQDSVFKE